MPDLKSIRQDKFIQQQVEERIRKLSGLDKTGTETKIKLNGNMNMFWNNKHRIAYKQLNITQWIEEKCGETKDCMLDYLIALLDDTNDFSWQSAMASHAVLLCQMGQGKISSWPETEKIESGMQMPRDIPLVPNLLLHSKKVRNLKVKLKPIKVTKSMPCVYYNDRSYSY